MADNHIVPVGKAAWRGARISTPLITFIVSFIGSGSYFAEPIEVLAISGAIMGAGALLGVMGQGLLTLIRSNSLTAIEAKLEKAQSLLERGLIDREDYAELKADILSTRHIGPINWRSIMWIVLLFSLIASAVITEGVGLLALLPSAAVGAGIGVGVRAIKKRRAEKQLPSPARSWQQLGTHGEGQLPTE